MYPLNPGEVTDQQLAPSVHSQLQIILTHPCFQKKEALHQWHLEENYDMGDPDYLAWVKINHPEVNTSSTEASLV